MACRPTTSPASACVALARASARATRKVLSLFLNLDPREFATAAARGTEVRSLLDRAAPPDARGRGRSATPRRRRCAPTSSASRPSSAAAAWTPRARTAWPSSPRAPPASSRSSSSPSPSSTTRSSPTRPSSSRCRPSARPSAGARCSSTAAWRGVFCGPGAALEEVELIEDELRRRHDQGGWSQANYQRSIDKDADDHLRHAAKVAFAHLQARPARRDPRRLPRRSSPAAFEAHLHPYLRKRLAGRLDLDVEHTSAEEVRRAAAARIEAAGRAREDAALARLVEAFAGGPGRAASGLPEVLAVPSTSSASRRCSSRPASRRPGSRCPTCGWLGADGIAACPADGSADRARWTTSSRRPSSAR